MYQKYQSLKGILFLTLLTVSSFIFSQSITGPDTVCQGSSATYYYSGSGGQTYLWSSILGYPSQSLSDSVLVTWVNNGTSGKVQVTVLDSNGLTIGTVQKTVVVIEPPTPFITSDFELLCKSQLYETIQFDTIFCKVVCDSSIVTYQTPYVAGNTYTWEVSGNLSDTADDNELVVIWDTLPGMGYVRVTETDEYGCSSIYEICVEIIESPSIDTSFGSTISLCTNEKLDITKHMKTSGATRYFWDFGDGNTSIEKDPTHKYKSVGNYNLRFIIENACGCTDSLNVTVEVQGGPSPEVYCISTVCEGESHVYTIPADSSGNYYWNNLTGLVNPVTAGQNTASATIKWLGCDVNGYGIINVYKAGSQSCDQNEFVPIITSIGSYIEGPTTVCANTQYTYTMPPVPGSKFLWTVTGGTIALNGTSSIYGQDLRHIAIDWDSVTPGTITVDFYNHALGCGDSLTLSVDVLKEYTISGETDGCENIQYTFTAANGAAGTFEWEVYKMGVGIESAKAAGSSTFNYTFGSGGEYEIRAYNNSGNFCNSLARHRIKISDVAPAPPSPIGDTLICKDDYYFYQSQPYSNDYFLEWDITGGSPSTSNNNAVTINWNTAGPNYSIKVYNVSKDYPYCRSDSVELLVDKMDTSNYNPVFTRDADVCANSTTYHGITNNANVEYDYVEWSLIPPEIGSILSGQGTRNISVQWSNSVAAGYMGFIGVICGDTVGDTILQHTIFNPDILISNAGGGSFCPNSTVTFNQLFTSGTYVTQKKWYFGDGNTQITTAYSNIQHTYTSSGYYKVKLEVTYGGDCPEVKTSNVLNILIYNPPQGNLSTDTTPEFCPADDSTTVINIYLTGQGLNTSSNYSFVWYKGASTHTPTNPPFQHTVDSVHSTTLGSYKVKITDNTTGCYTYTNIINVDTCDPGSGGGPPACNPDSVTVDFTYSLDTTDCGKVTFSRSYNDPQNIVSNISWNFNYGDGTSGSSVTHTYDSAKYYNVSLAMTFLKNGTDTCVAAVTKMIKVPVYADFDYYQVCDTGANMLLKTINKSGWVVDAITSTTWTPTASGNTPSFSLSAGSHNITMKVTSSGGTCQITKSVTINQKIIADFNIQTGPYCEQTPISFTDNSSGSIYRWLYDHGDGTTALLQNSTRTYNDETQAWNPYDVKLYISDTYGCLDSATQQIIVNNNGLKSASILTTGTVPFCSGDSVGLSTINKGSSSPFTYSWTTTETTSSIYVKNTGKYFVTVSDAYNCSYRTPPVNIGVNYTPVASPRGLTEYCPWKIVELDMFAGFTYDYDWIKNSTYAGDSSYLQYTAGSGPSTDNIKAIVTDNNCSDTTDIEITINQLPTINSISVSPNDCESSSPTITVSASGTGLKYNWSNGETTSAITVNSAGLYRVTVTNGVGCDTTAEVEIYPRPDFSTLMTGCYDFCLTDTPRVVIQGLNPTFYSHVWLNITSGPPVVFSTADTLVLDSAAHYKFQLVATNLNSSGCSDTSDVIEIYLFGCDECQSGIVSINSIECTERDSSFRWQYDFEIVVLDTFQGTITISPEYGQVSNVSTNLLTNQYDTITGTFTPLDSATDSICLNIEFISLIYGICEYRICDTLPTCHMPCEVDSIFIDSILCTGLDENGLYQYYFEARIYNAGSSYLMIQASIDSGYVSGLSLDSIGTGMNNITGYIHSIDTGYNCIEWGFFEKGTGGDSYKCCEQEICFEFPSCDSLDECEDFDADTWNVQCIGKDGDGHNIYSFSVNLNNNNSSVYTYLYSSIGGYLYGLSPTYIVNGVNTITGYYTNTNDSSTLCLYLTLVDTSDNSMCYLEICSDVLDNCDEAQDCGWTVEGTTRVTCNGTDGNGKTYYNFSITINNGAGFSGYVKSSSPYLWFNQPSSVGPGSSTLTGGFFNYSQAANICFEIYIYDTITNNYCTEEICFNDLPQCCETISARRAPNQENEDERQRFGVQYGNLLKIYPNPSDNLVNISYEINEENHGSIYLTDMLTNRLIEYNFLKGKGIIKLNTNSLNEGIYFVVLQIDGHIEETSKLIILH